MPIDQDAAYIRVFSFPEVVADFIEEFVDAPWFKALDPPILERKILPDARGFRKRANTVLWDVVRGKKQGPNIGLMLQFQDDDDYGTPLRTMGRVFDILSLEMERHGPPVPPLFPIVLYSGLGRWAPPLDFQETIAGDLPVRLWKMQPSVPYRVVQERFCSLLNRPRANLAVLLFQAERTHDVEEFVDTVERFSEALQVRGGSHVELERALVAWLRQVVLKARAPGIDVSGAKTFDSLREETERIVKPWAERHAKTALTESRKTARAEGIKRVLGRYARTRFGDKVGRLLSDLLAPIQSARKLLEVGALLGKVEDGTEFLRLLRGLWDPSLGTDSLPDMGIQ